MTKMIRWYDEDHELNVVLYPQDNTALRMLQQKLQQFFPFAKSLEDYLFPALFCQTNIDQFKEHKAKGRSEDSGRPSYNDLKTLTFSKTLSHI